MRLPRRDALFAAAFSAALVLAACSMQEPSVVDPLDPEPVDADSLLIQPQGPVTGVSVPVTFTVADTTATGNPASGPTTWTTSGGSITSDGVFTATAAGIYSVKAARGAKSGRSTITVTSSATLTAINISPASISLQPDSSFTFAATGLQSDGASFPVSVTWSATGGSVNNNGVYHAGTTAGSFRVVATQQGGTLADSAIITISGAPPTLTAIEVTPASVTVTPGATQQFSAIGRLSNGNTATVMVNWTATGGSVNSSGLYTAGSSTGSFRVIAMRQGDSKADTSVVTIAAAAPGVTLTAVEVTPAGVSLTMGGIQQFSAVGRMSDGSTAGVSVTWSATGGTVSGAGLYTAGSTAGTFRVIATAQGGTRADTTAVTVTAPAPALTAVVLTPAIVSLQTGATQQFTAVGRMSDGSTVAVPVTYGATGGTVTSGGLYTAGSTTGGFRVIATQQGGTKADTVALTITAPTPTLVAVEVTPVTASLAVGATRQFTAVGRMSDNSTQAVTVSWSATGGTITPAGLYTAGSAAGTGYRVIATGGGRADTAVVTVTAGATLSAVEVTPATASVTAGGTQQFTAIGRNSDNSTSAVTVTWSATGGAITSAGLYTAGSTAGTAYRVIAVQQGGTKADTSAVTVTVTVTPPPGTGLALTAYRLASGSGGTVISAGVPLQPGQVQPGGVSGVGLWKNGAEVAASIEALEGRYADGSVIALLVQYDAGAMTKGTGVGGYELRFTGSSVGRAARNAGAIKDVPDGVWQLPPTHFKAPVAAVWGPLVPLSELPGGDVLTLTQQYKAISDARWAFEAVSGAENGTNASFDKVEFYDSAYDQTLNHFRYGAQAADITMHERALRKAAVVRDFWRVQPGQFIWYLQNRHIVGLHAAAYWWTGVSLYRTEFYKLAANNAGNTVLQPQWISPSFSTEEGRVLARNMGWALSLQMLGYTAPVGGFTPPQWLSTIAQHELSSQTASGAWFEGAGDAVNGQKQFMAALRVYYLALYMEYRGAAWGGPSDAAIQQAIVKNADFTKTTWDGGQRTWKYISTDGSADANQPNLALLDGSSQMLAYRYTGNSSYQTQLQQAWAMSAGAIPSGTIDMRCGAFYCQKAYNEDYYTWSFMVAKYLGR